MCLCTDFVRWVAERKSLACLESRSEAAMCHRATTATAHFDFFLFGFPFERALMIRHSPMGRVPLHDETIRRSSDASCLRSASLPSTSFKCNSAIRQTFAHEEPLSDDRRRKSRI